MDQDPRTCEHGEAELRLGRGGGAYCRKCGTFASFADAIEGRPESLADVVAGRYVSVGLDSPAGAGADVEAERG